MFELLHRLYQRDVGSGSYRRTLTVALGMLAASLGILAALSRLPFREVLTAEGVVTPRQLELVRGEASAIIRSNQLQLGQLYAPGAPLLTVATGDGAEHVYTAPCRCVISRSDLLQRAVGELRAGELVAELIDPSSPEVRFPVNGHWRTAIAAGAKVHVVDDAGRSRQGAIARVYPRRADQLGLEAVATLPADAALTLGGHLTVRFEAPPVPLWRFFLNNLGR